MTDDMINSINKICNSYGYDSINSLREEFIKQIEENFEKIKKTCIVKYYLCEECSEDFEAKEHEKKCGVDNKK